MNQTDRATLARYVTNIDGDVFALKNLPEEVAAVLFAYYSRSTGGLRDNLLKLISGGELDIEANPAAEAQGDGALLEDAKAKAKAFHEKWVVGYGHSSVAEHAVIKLALENVSILASKLIEDSRLASYTEKSTRYVAFDPTKAHYPRNVMESPVAGAYREGIERLMGAYERLMPVVLEKVKQRTPIGEKQTPRAYEAACRSTACDTLRYLLPTASHTNIGITANARTLENMISKLLSSPLDEARDLGEAVKIEAQKLAPSLLKYAERSEYRAESFENLSRLSSSPIVASLGRNSAKLVAPYLSEDDALQLIALRAETGRDEADFIDNLLKNRGAHDAVPRDFERVFVTFEIVMDYGAFRDIQRHRLATLTTDRLTPDLGWESPRDLDDFGLRVSYEHLMEQSIKTYEKIAQAGFEDEAAYALPLAFRVRTLLTANLREMFHLIELRSSRQGHPSYRKIAQELWAELNSVYPAIAKHIRVNLRDYALTRPV